MTSAILTGSLLTKATGHHDRFYYAGSPGAGSADVEARSGPKLAPEPQQKADCDENKLRLGAPGAVAAHEFGQDGNPLGEQIYAEACAGCHGWTGESPISGLASIAGTCAVNDPSGVNVAQVILFGGGQKPGEAGMAMPSFGEAYSDAEIAAVANYATARLGVGSRLTPENVAALRLTR